MDDIKKLLSDLHSQAADLRNSATMALWNRWYFEAGKVAEADIRKGDDLLGLQQFEEARLYFKKVVKAYPNFC